MIKFENIEVVGWEHALRGMRNPKNSWDKSDSCWGTECRAHGSKVFVVGDNDIDLASRLAEGGPVHAKYRRMLVVYMDITAPLYWWKEFDTYKVGTVANSCSTMHKIHAKEFSLEDFSYEHLFGDINPEYWATITDEDGNLMNTDGVTCLLQTIKVLNYYREQFIETKDKKFWWQMIQLLPSSYNQKRTVMLNYEVLSNIYESRYNHKLNEWREFCNMIVGLPYANDLIL